MNNNGKSRETAVVKAKTHSLGEAVPLLTVGLKHKGGSVVKLTNNV